MKKKLLLISAAVIVIAAICVVGYTLAYFTDTADATNTFTVGDVTIKLTEADVTEGTDPNTGGTTWEKETTRNEDGNTYNGIYPSARLPKDPTVENVGKNACYVQMEVTVPGALLEYYDEYISFEVSDDSDAAWAKIDSLCGDVGMAGDYKLVYQYKSILLKDKSTKPLFDAVLISEDAGNDVMDALRTAAGTDGLKIDIVAKAIQADGFIDDADGTAMEKAFTALNTPNP